MTVKEMVTTLNHGPGLQVGLHVEDALVQHVLPSRYGGALPN